MKKMRLTIIRFLLFFYLCSSFLSATHIHNEALESPADCKVCIVVKNLHGGDTTTSEIVPLGCGGCYEPILFWLETPTIIKLKGFNANAPPYFS